MRRLINASLGSLFNYISNNILKMNDRSSRAHSLFIIRLEQCNPSSGAKCSSKLYLADLGGFDVAPTFSQSDADLSARESARTQPSVSSTGSAPASRHSRRQPRIGSASEDSERS